MSKDDRSAGLQRPLLLEWCWLGRPWQLSPWFFQLLLHLLYHFLFQLVLPQIVLKWSLLWPVDNGEDQFSSSSWGLENHFSPLGNMPLQYLEQCTKMEGKMELHVGGFSSFFFELFLLPKYQPKRGDNLGWGKLFRFKYGIKNYFQLAKTNLRT